MDNHRIAEELIRLGIAPKPKRRRVTKTDEQWEAIWLNIGVRLPDPPKKGMDAKTDKTNRKVRTKSNKPKKEKTEKNPEAPKKKRITIREATDAWRTALKNSGQLGKPVPEYAPMRITEIVKTAPMRAYVSPEYDAAIPYGPAYGEWRKTR